MEATKSIFAYVKEARDNYRTDINQVEHGYGFLGIEKLDAIELNAALDVYAAMQLHHADLDEVLPLSFEIL